MSKCAKRGAWKSASIYVLSAVSLASLGGVQGCKYGGRISDAGGETDIAAREAMALRLIEAQTFAALPVEHRAMIAAAGQAPAGPTDGRAAPAWESLRPLGEEEYELVSRYVSRGLWDRMRPVHQHALVDTLLRRAAGEDVPVLCFAPDSDPELMRAFNDVFAGRLGVRFQNGSRWTNTATNGGGLSQGQPTTLTYSFPPDGTTSPTLTSATQPSDLFAFLNGIYGSPAVWQPIYAQVFARWSALCNVTYVFEPNDDGVPLSGNNPGVLGVRGDLRLTGTALDGPSNVLAFNSFPNNGDMVIDTADNFFSSTSSNSLRLRNVLAHEHGHGMGMPHVCPVNGTKLMEPFINLGYDGPQLDDTLSGQRMYGDINEPNDTVATATVIAAATTTATTTVRNVSCDDGSDVDVYRVSVPAAGLLTVTVRPIGGTYLSGPQNNDGSCSAGSAFAAVSLNDLNVTILGSDGVTELTSVNAGAAGASETAIGLVAGASDVYIRVGAANAPAVQGYEIDYRLQGAPAMVVTLADAAPAVLSPVGGTTFRVRIQTVGDTVTAGSAVLNYRFSTLTGFSSAALAPLGGDMFEARIPAAPCGSTPQFYVQASGVLSGVRVVPAGAPGLNGLSAFAASSQVTSLIFADDFETNRGWTVGAGDDTATAGLWERGDPVGTTAQPEDDHSELGTQCFFTGQAARGAQPGTADVDGGKTTLTSPRMDLAGAASARLTYWRWYSNVGGASPGLDTFRVDASSDDGQTWTNIQTVGPATDNTGGWVKSDVSLGGIAATSQVRVRFIAEDADPGSLVEAAIDDVSVQDVGCTNRCLGDYNGDRAHTVQDLFDFLGGYFGGDERADLTGEGTLSVQDIFTFLGVWFGPCP